MADKLTLLELHLHAEDNEFESEMEFSSDIGSLLRRRLGLGGESDEEPEIEGPDGHGPGAGIEAGGPTAETTTDGGDAVQVDEEDEEGGAVVEIDPDADLDDGSESDDADDSGGRSTGKTLLVLVVLVGLALLARRYLGGDDVADEFEEL